MKSKIVKKILSVIIGTSIISLTTIGSVSAMENTDFTISETNDDSIIYRIGGGPSPSASWSYYGTTTKTFSRSQLQSLYNQAYAAHNAGRKSKLAYDFSVVILGFAGKPGAIMGTFISFQDTQFDLVQTSLNTLGRALASGKSSVKVEIKTWKRQANGQYMSVFTRLP